MELPPRARRILFQAGVAGSKPGTTSAHAENTWGTGHGSPRIRNYLRARGKYSSGRSVASSRRELSPRARRIYSIGVEIGFPPVVFLLPVVVLTHVSGVVSGVTP